MKLKELFAAPDYTVFSVLGSPWTLVSRETLGRNHLAHVVPGDTPRQHGLWKIAVYLHATGEVGIEVWSPGDLIREEISGANMEFGCDAVLGTILPKMRMVASDWAEADTRGFWAHADLMRSRLYSELRTLKKKLESEVGK